MSWRWLDLFNPRRSMAVFSCRRRLVQLFVISHSALFIPDYLHTLGWLAECTVFTVGHLFFSANLHVLEQKKIKSCQNLATFKQFFSVTKCYTRIIVRSLQQCLRRKKFKILSVCRICWKFFNEMFHQTT